MAGVNKEIWIPEILEGFYPDTSFVSESENYDSFVEYNTINLADAGVEPDVLVDNNVYPVPFAQRTDTPISIPLGTLDTEGTVVRNVEQMEAAYDKMQSVAAQHRKALQKTSGALAAHNWLPASNGAKTPVLASNGAAKDGFLNITLDQVDGMHEDFAMFDAPDEGRVLLLHPYHYRQLKAEDRKLFKDYMQTGRQGFDLLGWKTYITRLTPRFNSGTGAKVAYGAVAAGTDTISSGFYCKSEVMRAMGTMEMFARLKDPEQKGDIINFQMRFSALPLRNVARGAIYSAVDPG